MITLNFVTGRVGCGKTHAAINYIANNPADLYLISCPSTELCNQISANIKTTNPKLNVTAIHSADGFVSDKEVTVTSRIVKHLKNARAIGEVLIITHAAYDLLPYFEGKARWNLIVDEAPQVAWHDPINLAHHADLVLDMLDTPISISSSYSEIEPDRSTDHFHDLMADITNDAVYTRLRPLGHRLGHNHWRVYTNSEQFENFSKNRGDKGKGDHNLDAFGLLQPSIYNGFKSVTIMAAEFDTTLAYVYWSQLADDQGLPLVEFVPHPDIQPRQIENPVAHLINVHYMLDQTFSKNMGKKDVAGVKGASVNQAIEATLKEYLGDRPYLILHNIGYESYYPDDKAINLPHASHGLNKFQNIDIACVHAALNPSPQMFQFLEEIGHIPALQVHTAISHHPMLQAVGRCSIRDYTNTNQRIIIVPDIATATFISKSLGASAPSPLSEINLAPVEKKVGRTKIHASHAAQLESLRRSKSESEREEIIYINQWVNSEKSGETKPLYNKAFRLSHFGTVFDTVMSSNPLGEIEYASHNEFVDLLRILSADAIEKKENRPLISPAIFQPIEGIKEKRGIANVVSANGIWMDNDGGDLTPQQFANMFPHTEMYIWNTFSSTLAKPRWRVYIPTTLRTGVKSYNALTAEITRKLERRGYFHNPEKVNRKGPILKTGFDATKLSPQNLFYLPSTNSAKPEAAFFLEFKGGNRSPINPLEWIKHSVPKVEAPVIAPAPIRPMVAEPNPNASDQLRKLQAAIIKKQNEGREGIIQIAEDDYASRPPHTGHLAFFKLAAALRKAGLDDIEVKSKLIDHAWMSGSSRAKRLREIEGLVRKLYG